MDFSSNLIYLRKLKGINQVALARELGLSNTQISNWEKGIALPEIQAMLKISNYFGISVNDLISKNVQNEPLVVHEDPGNYKPPGECERCADKDKTIKSLNKLVHIQDEEILRLNARINDLEGKSGQKRKAG